MKRRINLKSKIGAIALCSIILATSLTGCGKEDKPNLVGDYEGNTSIDLTQDIADKTTIKSYSDEEVKLQPMGTWRLTEDEAFQKAKELKLIPEDVTKEQKVTKEELIKALENLDIAFIDIESISDNMFIDSENLKVEDFINIMGLILNSYKIAGSDDIFTNDMFRESFRYYNNDTESLSDDLILKMSLLRYFDALLINEDDVFILNNSLNYNILANGLIRLLDLRVEQLVKDNFPEECQVCGTHVDKWYPLLEKMDPDKNSIELKLDKSNSIKLVKGTVKEEKNIDKQSSDENNKEDAKVDYNDTEPEVDGAIVEE